VTNVGVAIGLREDDLRSHHPALALMFVLQLLAILVVPIFVVIPDPSHNL